MGLKNKPAHSSTFLLLLQDYIASLFYEAYSPRMGDLFFKINERSSRKLHKKMKYFDFVYVVVIISIENFHLHHFRPSSPRALQNYLASPGSG